MRMRCASPHSAGALENRGMCWLPERHQPVPHGRAANMHAHMHMSGMRPMAYPAAQPPADGGRLAPASVLCLMPGLYTAYGLAALLLATRWHRSVLACIHMAGSRRQPRLWVMLAALLLPLPPTCCRSKGTAALCFYVGPCRASAFAVAW